MVKRYNNISLCFGVPGLILQILGFILRSPQRHADGKVPATVFLILLAGTVLLLIGLAYYAKAKGRHPAWCLLAFLSIIGLVVLGCLRDKCVTQTEQKHSAGPGKPRKVIGLVVLVILLFVLAVVLLTFTFRVF